MLCPFKKVTETPERLFWDEGESFRRSTEYFGECNGGACELFNQEQGACSFYLIGQALSRQPGKTK